MYHGSLCSDAICENGSLLMKCIPVSAWRRSHDQKYNTCLCSDKEQRHSRPLYNLLQNFDRINQAQMVNPVVLIQVCETLDRRKGVESSEMWPQPPAAAVESDAIQENEAQDSSTSAVEEVAQEPSWEDWPVQAKLALVLDYLRQMYHYCIFCGSQVSFVCRADLECDT